MHMLEIIIISGYCWGAKHIVLTLDKNLSTQRCSQICQLITNAVRPNLRSQGRGWVRPILYEATKSPGNEVVYEGLLKVGAHTTISVG